MAPFTGGCHYAWDCKGHLSNCGKCPALYSSNPDDLTYKNFLYKKKYLDIIPINIIAASEWQYRQAKNSSLFRNKNIYKVLLSVNTLIFKPANKEELRLELSIPPQKKVVFFGSMGLKSKRKGMMYLIESLQILNKKIS
ncbi:MAG TPA: hypothetical protein VIK14_10755 [Ignavibacteria bacterium]